jgi:FKBP-type peptidyl-prolyl cis-trans isomerase FkpA
MNKKLLLLTTTFGATFTLFAIAQNDPAMGPAIVPAQGTATTLPATAPTTQETLSTVSYGLGYDMGRNLKQAEVQLDIALFTQGYQDAQNGVAQRFSDEQLRTAFTAIQTTMMEREAAKAAEADAKADEQNKAFFEANKAKPNIKSTPSGLQYEIVQEGTGPQPQASDVVRVHYTGTLLDGTKFDSSVDRGEPAEFPLSRVIPGWTEGIQLLKVGSKAKLYIPADLGYGPQGSGPIPPNATLIFDVELLDIVPPATQPAGGPVPTQMP